MIGIRRISAEETLAIRHAVLWPNMPLEHVKLAGDQDAYHYGLYYEHELISVISVFLDGSEARFRKFATKKSHQGKGYGSRLFDYMLDQLKDMAVERVWCDARVDALGFYRRFGFSEVGEVFYKSHVPYKVMEKRLKK